MTRALLALALLSASGTAAQAEILSVATAKANVRDGPGTKFPVLWKAWRLTPFQVIDWAGDWAKVADFAGDVGWLHTSVLSEAAAVIVVTKTAAVREGPGTGYDVLWQLESEYPLRVLERRGHWLKVSDGGEVRGWVLRRSVWGNPDPEEPNA